METIRVVDPGGRQTVDDTLAFEPPGRPGTLASARLAVLDNGKPNAAFALSGLAAVLANRSGAVAGPALGKSLSSKPCPEDLLGRLEGADAALVGIGD